MERNSTFIRLFILVASSFFSPKINATVYIDNGSSTTYNLNAGDSLNIASGTFTGTIGSFPAGAKIAVSSGAVFQPASMTFPDVHGTLYVYGTFKMTSPLRTNSGFVLNNYGVTWVTSTTLMSGSSQLWTNYYGGLIKMDGDVTMTNDNKIVNNGTITFGANMTMTGTTSITNKNVITVAGNYLNSGGTFNNEGKFETTGSITFNNGQAIINNYCRMISQGGINNTSGYVNNYNFIWAKSSTGQGNIVNSGTITNGPNATIKSVTLNNTGIVNGSGYLYFTGNTTTTNLGTTGTAGITSDTIRFYDGSRSNPLTIYDNQTGIVNPNVVYQVLPAPDTTATFLTGCSIQLMAIPLPVKWHYFYVNLEGNTPILNWSASYVPGKTFEIQRSYNNVDFYGIKKMTAENSKTVYTFDDGQVNNKYFMAYYRIKAIEPEGTQNFSETKMVKFNRETGGRLQLVPNPFVSDFSINYNAPENGKINIRVFNLNGQEKLRKEIAINIGYNSTTINGSSHLASGIYLVEISQGNRLISTLKVIKQGAID